MWILSKRKLTVILYFNYLNRASDKELDADNIFGFVIIISHQTMLSGLFQTSIEIIQKAIFTKLIFMIGVDRRMVMVMVMGMRMIVLVVKNLVNK